MHIFGKAKIMEELYKSLLSGVDTLTEQFKGHLFDMTELEGPVLMLVNDKGALCATHPSRVAFLNEDDVILSVLCGQVDDGY